LSAPAVGETSALEPRPVTIHQLELLGWDGDNQRLKLAVSLLSGHLTSAPWPAI